MTRRITAAAARRYLVLRHLLAPARSLPPEPASVLSVVERLGTLQFDPIDVAGRNHDLTLLARIGGYRREWTDELLYRDRALYETYNKGLSLVPTAELPWYRATWDQSRVRHATSTFTEHAELMEELLERIRENGGLAATDIPARPSIDWWWRPTNQVRAMLEALALAGVLGLERRDGNRRVYNLVERLFPASLLEQQVPLDEQRDHRLLSRYRAHGLLAPTSSTEVWLSAGDLDLTRRRNHYRQRLVDQGLIVPLEVEGLRGVRHLPAADVAYLDRAEAELAEGVPPGGAQPTVAFLAPLDPLAWDRKLLRDLFGFDYIWEVYVPEAKRRWGYYVLPLLHGDTLAGRIELRADRKAGVLEVAGLWWEDRAAEPSREALDAALEAHRAFLGLKRIRRAVRAGRRAPRRSASRS